MEDRAEKQGPYVIFMLVLSILSLVALAFSVSPGLDEDQKDILQVADTAVCMLFLVDFLVTLYWAPNRLKYFLRWGWLDLLSSVPMIDALRVTRLARVFRILRLIRAVKATKILATFIMGKRAESAFLAVSLISLLLLVVSSISILHFETLPDSNIRTGEDAVWWAITSITTVGYGDKFPITSEGRIIAAILMVSGVGLFGTLSGFIASWFLKPAERDISADIDVLIAEVRDLKAMLKR